MTEPHERRRATAEDRPKVVHPRPAPVDRPESIDLRDGAALLSDLSTKAASAARHPVGAWLLEHLPALLAVVIALAAIIYSNQQSQSSIAYQQQVRQRAQAEKVIFLNSESQIMQNYSDLPILGVTLEYQERAGDPGYVFVVGSLGPCEQIDAQKVPHSTGRTGFKIHPDGGGARMRFMDSANRWWSRDLDGPLRRVRYTDDYDDGDDGGAKLSPLLGVLSIEEAPREPIGRCGPG